MFKKGVKHCTYLERSRFNTIEECENHYKDGFHNKFRVMHIGNTLVVRNYYMGQFAWLCEYIEMTEEEFNEQVCEEGQ